MLTGIDKNGEMKNVLVSEDGEIFVKIGGSSDGGSEQEQKVITESKETTLYSNVITAGVEEQTIGVNKKVTEISIANYSETANVLISVDDSNFVVAPNLALDLPINKSVGIVGLSATEADTQVQYVIKGEE